MAEHKHFISIWFFIGLLLTVYGVLIMGSGLYELSAPAPAAAQGGIESNVMPNLHAAIWWGALLLVSGLVYVIGFRPGKER
jgi:hypothetical protein